jgi:hypothetical protein
MIADSTLSFGSGEPSLIFLLPNFYPFSGEVFVVGIHLALLPILLSIHPRPSSNAVLAFSPSFNANGNSSSDYSILVPRNQKYTAEI